MTQMLMICRLSSVVCLSVSVCLYACKTIIQRLYNMKVHMSLPIYLFNRLQYVCLRIMRGQSFTVMTSNRGTSFLYSLVYDEMNTPIIRSGSRQRRQYSLGSSVFKR